jgi:hypothetical protein
MSRSLLLAPRPFPGESIRSWIGRLASRYDLIAPELMARLSAQHPVSGARIASLDGRHDVALEALLARVTHVGSARISAMRVVADESQTLVFGRRDAFVWCPACADDDVRRHGECYERTVWRLGCCTFCPAHQQVLVDVCPRCAFGQVAFQAVAGRQRLVCALCRQRVDALPKGDRLIDPGVRRQSWFELPYCPQRTELAAALQTLLLGQANGPILPIPRPFDLPVQGIGIIARDLAESLLWPQGFGQPQTGVGMRDQGWTGLPPRIAHEVLGIVAGVLTKMADTHARGAVADQSGMANGAGVDLAWLVRRLPAHERRVLAEKAMAWGPLLAEIVGSLVDECNRVGHGWRGAREAPKDAAWVRQATVRYASDARRRIAARAAKRAESKRQGQARSTGSL